MNDEVLERTEESQVSRRGLLVKSGLAAAGLTVLGRPAAPALGATQAVAIHGLSHGIGGADPLVNGLVATNQGVNIASNLFSLSPRSAPDLKFPVPALRPEGGTNQNIALDLMPRGAPGNFSSNGICWIDVCDTDILTTNLGNVGCARVGIFTDHVEFGSRGFGSSSPKPMWIGVGMDGLIGTAQIRVDRGSIIIGAERTGGSAVVLGNGIALGTGATTGFTYLPSMAGTPTGSAQTFGAQVPIVIDTAAGKLWARLGGTWKSVTFA